MQRRTAKPVNRNSYKSGSRKASRKHSRNRRMSDGARTLLWLILFFPVGLTLMWRSKCSWRPAVKYAVSGLTLALLAAVLIYPSPYRKLSGTVELYGDDPEVEVYGPELPETIVEGYSSTAVSSVVKSTGEQTDSTVYVYAAKDAKCYHLSDCKFAFASAQRMTVYEAYYLGYAPCGRCNPPIYSPTEKAVVTNPADAVEVAAENNAANVEAAVAAVSGN